MSNRVTDPTSKTAAEWLELAADCTRREQESWERSDTDGFLSQWASQKMAQRYRTLAEIAEDGGLYELSFLGDTEGNRIEGARYVETRYGWSWVYDTEAGETVWFRESNHSNPEVAKKRNLAKGHQVLWIKVPVVMYSDGSLHEKRG